MGCDNPITAYRSQEWNPETKRYGITFSRKAALNPDSSINVPCGKCTGCRLERSRQWAVRCTHESRMHERNCFITLTYSDAHYPVDGSVHQRDFQLFMKKLRKQIAPTRIRFFACGEYGDKSGRAHYHALIFGYDPPDKIHYETTPQGHKLYLSHSLQQAWPLGRAPIGALTYQTAAYTARYAMKKINGPLAEQHYVRVHPQHGFICRVRPEFLLMSRGGRDGKGIGYEWFQKHGKETFVHDSVIMDGYEAQPPRFYFNQLSQEDKDRITKKRAEGARKNPRNYDSFNEYDAHVQVRDSKISTLKRKL